MKEFADNKLPNPSREKRKTKFRNKRVDFISDNGLKERENKMFIDIGKG